MFPVINRVETGLNLRRIMERRDITAKDVQQYLGLGCVQSVYRWLEGISLPSIDNLYALSELFHLPIDELVCGNRTKLRAGYMDATSLSLNKRVYAYYSMLNGRHIA